MPKKKKTRQQKILADQRREAHNASIYSLPPESLKEQVKQPIILVKQTSVINIASYQHLAVDLRKTALFTGFIVLMELILKFFIKN